MKVPLSWLKEYLNLTQSPEELANVLTLAGIEVEGIEASPLKFSGVVVGLVLETSKPPFRRPPLHRESHRWKRRVSSRLRRPQLQGGAQNRFCQDWRLACRRGRKIV